MRMRARYVLGIAVVGLAPITVAAAQDVPGIEICTVEKTMERRTSCLQSNVDFLTKSIIKASLDNQQKIDAANRQVEALKAAVVGLQKTNEQLQTRLLALETKKEPAKETAKELPAK